VINNSTKLFANKNLPEYFSLVSGLQMRALAFSEFHLKNSKNWASLVKSVKIIMKSAQINISNLR